MLSAFWQARLGRVLLHGGLQSSTAYRAAALGDKHVGGLLPSQRQFTSWEDFTELFPGRLLFSVFRLPHTCCYACAVVVELRGVGHSRLEDRRQCFCCRPIVYFSAPSVDCEEIIANGSQLSHLARVLPFR